MNERSKWDDERLDAQFAHIDDRFDRLEARFNERFDRLQISLSITLGSIVAAFLASH